MEVLISDKQTFDQRIGLNQREREREREPEPCDYEGTVLQTEGAASTKDYGRSRPLGVE